MAGEEPTRIGRYVLHGQIASGGMATVHLGRLKRPGFSRVVAIKRLLPELAQDPQFAERFVDEARMAASIRHPNVVATHDVESTDDELFLVMDYVQGDSLATLLKRARASGENVPVDVAAAIVVAALHGIHAAHEALGADGKPLDIIHRDVSPQNILVGVDGVARVLDFGIAKAVGQLHTTAVGVLKGKIPYMAPEQLSSGPIDHRVDVYAAGVVLWEALTGRRLFDADDQAALIGDILEGNVGAPSAFNADVPRELDVVVLRALSAQPELRFESAETLADAIEASTPLASPRAVGRWVEGLAHESLVERARLVTEIEMQSTAAAAPAVAPSEAGPPAPRRRAAVIAALVMLAVLLFGGGLWLGTRSDTEAPVADGPAPAASGAARVAAPPTPTAPSAVATVADTPAEPSAAPASVVAAPAVDAARAAPTKPPSAPRTKRPPKRVPSCRVPYVLDAHGKKTFRPECL